MEQPYSVWADLLDKFHASSDLVQALCAMPVTVRGVTWIVMRRLRDVAAAMRGRGEGTLYGVPNE